MEIHTIGFTRHSAADFFGALKQARVELLVDVRLHNVSQLAGFAKKDDLQFFLGELCDAGYRHELELAPTDDLLRSYRSRTIKWDEYASGYLRLLDQRRVTESIDFGPVSRIALLCSEHTPERCHRRLAAEYLAGHLPDLTISHL